MKRRTADRRFMTGTPDAKPLFGTRNEPTRHGPATTARLLCITGATARHRLALVICAITSRARALYLVSAAVGGKAGALCRLVL